MPILEGRGLYRFYHDGDTETAALKGVDLSLEAGEFVALTGPSGSGKSTLIACLAGLDDPDGGTVTIMGEHMSRRPERQRARLRARHFGIMMQSGNLIEHLTVAGNMRLQRDLAATAAPAAPEALLARLGIEHRGFAFPAQLSGGELARAALAVALSASPAVLICDEPTAEVDAETERDVLAVLKEHQQRGGAVLLATHSPVIASAAGRIVSLSDGAVV
jgi:putative ABC transport system ATP-binding protein